MRGNPCYNQGLGWVWVAYPGSVSAGVCRESWDERKKDRGMKGGGGGGGRRKRELLFPLPLLPFFFFCFPTSFRATVSLSKGVFDERTTGSETISLLILLDATKYMPSFFTITEAICPKF